MEAVPPAAVRRYLAWPLEDHWAVVHDGRWSGGMVAHRMDQWFGGRRVPCACIYGVQVVPEARGRGLGRTLFAEVLDRLGEAGVALAPLYPSDSRVYRAWGWEFAGQSQVVETYVSYLRRKLDPLGPPLIHTQRGVGYSLRPPPETERAGR